MSLLTDLDAFYTDHRQDPALGPFAAPRGLQSALEQRAQLRDERGTLARPCSWLSQAPAG
jgi:hypothetical protein